MTEFFTANKEVISGVSGIATALSLLIAGAALLFTGIQMRRNGRANMARSMYDLLSDSRQAVRRLLDNKQLAEDLLGKELTIEQRVLVEVGGIFSIYLAAYYQQSLKILDSKRWKPFEDDLSGFLQFPRAQEFWNEKTDKTRYDPKFVCIVERLLKASSEQPPNSGDSETEETRVEAENANNS